MIGTNHGSHFVRLRSTVVQVEDVDGEYGRGGDDYHTRREEDA